MYLLNKVYELERLGEHDAAQFVLFDGIQTLYNNEELFYIDNLLMEADPAKLSPLCMRAILSMTYGSKNKSRVELCDRIEKHLREKVYGDVTVDWLEKLK